MTVPILIESAAGLFTASVLGSPDVRFVGSSKDEAVAALQQELTRKISNGELVNLELSPAGAASLAGRFADDESLPAICSEIYRERDADQAR